MSPSALASPSSAEHGSSVSVCCSTIQLMLCCPPRQAFPQQHLCAVFYFYVLYIGEFFFMYHIYCGNAIFVWCSCCPKWTSCYVCLACLAHLPSFLGLQFHLSKVFVLLLCLKGHLLWVWVIRLLFRADDQDQI